VYAHAEYREMREHSAYSEAKSGNSVEAALSLVYDLINDKTIEHIKNVINECRPRIVGVHAEEALGRNKIPITYAEVLAEILDLSTDPGIVQASVANHGGSQSAYHRMVSQPVFDGYVEEGAHYLIVDDTCTVGGTLANLKGFIETKGGIVLGMSTLARRNVAHPYYIAPMDMQVTQLEHKHRGLGKYWQEEFGYGLDALTEGEAGHLLAAPSFDTIRNRLVEAGRDIYGDPSEEGDRSTQEAATEVDD
jgi:hypoxanthine-guanine phosphoribosyltransferase